MSKKKKTGFDNLIDEVDEANEQLGEPVAEEHPLVHEIVSDSNDALYRQKIGEVTSLIGDLEMAKVLLREAYSGVKTYTDALNRANENCAINIASAKSVASTLAKYAEEARETTIVVRLSDSQTKWLEDSRNKYIDNTNKAFEAQYRTLHKLGEEQFRTFQYTLERCCGSSVTIPD